MKLPNILPLVNKALKPLDNKLVGTTTRVALILYASLIAPELPDVVARQLDNLVVRSVLIFLIAYLAVKDPITAALATLALMVTVMSLHRRDVQSVLGQVGSLAKTPIDVAGDVVEGATNVVKNVLGFDGKEQAPVKEEAAAPEPTGYDPNEM
jgi:hypothetical protein